MRRHLHDNSQKHGIHINISVTYHHIITKGIAVSTLTSLEPFFETGKYVILSKASELHSSKWQNFKELHLLVALDICSSVEELCALQRHNFESLAIIMKTIMSYLSC